MYICRYIAWIVCVLAGYVGLRERQSSVGNYPVRDIQYANGRGMSLPLTSSPPAIHSSGSYQQVPLPQLTQPPQPPPTCIVKGSSDHMNNSKNHCSTEVVSDKRGTQKDESYALHHFHQLSNENRRISKTSTSSTVAGEHYIQKSTITTTSSAKP